MEMYKLAPPLESATSPFPLTKVYYHYVFHAKLEPWFVFHVAENLLVLHIVTKRCEHAFSQHHLHRHFQWFQCHRNPHTFFDTSLAPTDALHNGSFHSLHPSRIASRFPWLVSRDARIAIVVVVRIGRRANPSGFIFIALFLELSISQYFICSIYNQILFHGFLVSIGVYSTHETWQRASQRRMSKWVTAASSDSHVHFPYQNATVWQAYDRQTWFTLEKMSRTKVSFLRCKEVGTGLLARPTDGWWRLMMLGGR
jgi:hypothetical protein